jgi:hypothetical protein
MLVFRAFYSKQFLTKPMNHQNIFCLHRIISNKFAKLSWIFFSKFPLTALTIRIKKKIVPYPKLNKIFNVILEIPGIGLFSKNYDKHRKCKFFDLFWLISYKFESFWRFNNAKIRFQSISDQNIFAGPTTSLNTTFQILSFFPRKNRLLLIVPE